MDGRYTLNFRFNPLPAVKLGDTSFFRFIGLKGCCFNPLPAVKLGDTNRAWLLIDTPDEFQSAPSG